MVSVEQFCCNQSHSLRSCMQAIEQNTKGFIFLVDDDDTVSGLLTDGDIRRALIAGATLEDAGIEHANRDFRYVEHERREAILKALDTQVKFLPVIHNGKLSKVISLEDLVYVERESLTARSKAPARISFGGGGTDLTTFFAAHGGAALNATINLYAHASLTKKADQSIRLISRDYDLTVEADSIAYLKYDGKLDLVKAVVKLLKPDFGFELEIRCDFPPNSGLGGSSVVLASVIGCFNEFRHDKLSQHDIAELAFQCERLEMRNPGGWQDQYASVFGGFNFMEFRHNQNDISPLRLPKAVHLELEERIILCYTGKPHQSNAIQHKQKLQLRSNEKIIDLGKETRQLAYDMKSTLLRGHIDMFGELIHKGWEMKKHFAEGISDPHLDKIYETAQANGAIGGKILGTGGGGYFLFFVQNGARHRLFSALKDMNLNATQINLTDQGMTSWIVPHDLAPKKKDML